jgi:hypothetical protein|tara:strand:+ start:1257 stop:1697 length:441 start_codon:yes stop_codon:yes gene_type:complete
MKKQTPLNHFFIFKHDQIGHINTPFSIWADPHNFNSDLWADIKSTELRISKQMDETRPSFYDLCQYYLSLRKVARNILMAHKAQGKAPSLKLNASNLLTDLYSRPMSERIKYQKDINILKKFLNIYESIWIIYSWKPIADQWSPVV